MAEAGTKLMLVARREHQLRDVAAEICSHGAQVEIFPCDVTNACSMNAAVAECVNRFGRLDLLVNNAGQGLFATVEQTTEEDLDRMVALNLKGTFFGIKAALPVMRSQGKGHIINIASTAGLRGSPYVGAYCASKFAVVGLTESLRVELLGSGISVSLVCPGATTTEFFDAALRRTHQHQGLVGPVESVDAVAARVLEVAMRPSPRTIAQPFRRSIFLALNLFMPALVDRLLARLLSSNESRASRKATKGS